jgi:hypothetical protein
LEKKENSKYIFHELANYLEDKDMEHLRGRPMHPQTKEKLNAIFGP